VERFNKTFRSEVLNAHLFDSLTQVQEMAWWWMIEYNKERPHERIGIPKLLSQLLLIKLDAGQPAFHTESQDSRGEIPPEGKDRAPKPSCSKKTTTEGLHPIVTECHFTLKHPVNP